MTNETPTTAERSTFAMTAKAVVNVGGLATVLVALVTDVLASVGPFALYLAGVAFVLLLVFGLLSDIAPRVDDLGKRCFSGYWRKPVVATLITSAAVLVTAHFVTRSAPESGWLGSHVSVVRDLQDDLGVVDARTKEIAETAQSIKKDTRTIIEELDKVKKETSDDPRKELANLGVAWSTQSFVDALQAGDARVVKMFLAGGMSPTALHNGASAVLYILQAKLPNPVPMLKLMIDAGFDVNATLFDGVILRHYSDSLPPHFESPDLPDDYAAWQGTFGGPALLWVVIRSAYGFPIAEEWDLGAIDFLRRHGAKTRLPRQFLEAMAFAWGDYPAYQTVRAAIY